MYGTVPPREDSSQEKVYEIAEKLAARLAKLEIDAINVYDIQDEGDRNHSPRPFPLLTTIDPRQYSKLLKKLTGKETINYKCVVHHPKERFGDWLTETEERFGIRYLSLVGGSSLHGNYPGPTLSEASRAAASHKYRFIFGGVTIPERHAAKGNEHDYLIEKSREGMRFFTSQVVYQSDPTIRLLRDYYQECRRQSLSPAPIVLTFAPCGHPKTSLFLKWLGVKMSPETENEIFSARFPLQKSIEICCSNLRLILDSIANRNVSLGINVESVSIFKDEIDGSIDLFHELKAILDSFYRGKSGVTQASGG